MVQRAPCSISFQHGFRIDIDKISRHAKDALSDRFRAVWASPASPYVPALDPKPCHLWRQTNLDQFSARWARRGAKI
jgi:hypothetical protein